MDEHESRREELEERFEALYDQIIYRARINCNNPDDEGGEILSFVNDTITYCTEKQLLHCLEMSDEHLINYAALHVLHSHLTELRKRKREESIEPGFDEDGNEMPADDALFQLVMAHGTPEERDRHTVDNPADICENRLLFEEALTAMSERERFACILWSENYDGNEIAVLMNITRDAAYKLVQRGIASARKHFNNKK